MKIIVFLALSMLVSCSGGSGGSPNNPNNPNSPNVPSPPFGSTINGIFLDSAVKGLSYSTSNSETGKTDDNGQFTCTENSEISFFIGHALLGKALCNEVLTPIDLVFGSVDEETRTNIITENTEELRPSEQAKLIALKNMLILLQSLDSNPDTSGIQISESTAEHFNLVQFDFFDINMGLGKGIEELVSDINNSTEDELVAVDASRAMDHFNNTMNTPYLPDIELITNEDFSVSFSGSYHIISSGVGTNGTYSVGDEEPSHGVFNCTSNICTYEPNPDFYGTDIFSYTVTVGDKQSPSKTITVVVNPVNDAPYPLISANINSTLNEDTSSLIDLPEFIDPEGDAIAISIKTNPSHGVVSYSSINSQFTYTPNENFNGADSFVYTVSDGNGGNSDGLVSITVNPMNDAPTLAHSGETESVNTNSSGKEIVFTAQDIDGDTVSISVVNQPSNGSINCSGHSCNYIPTENFAGADSFTVRSFDGELYSENVVVSVLVIEALAVNPTIIISCLKSGNASAGVLHEPTEALTFVLDKTACGGQSSSTTRSLTFSSSKGENPYDLSSVEENNLVFEYSYEGAIASVFRNPSYHNANQITITPVVGQQGTASFKIRVSDTSTGEVSEWRTFSFEVITAPEPNGLVFIESFVDAKKEPISFQYIGTAVDKLVLNDFDPRFGVEEDSNLKLYVDDVLTAPEDNLEVSSTAVVSFEIKEGWKVGDTEYLWKLFDYRVSSNYNDERRYSTTTSDVYLHGQIKKNPRLQSLSTASLFANITKKIREAVNNSYPWKDYTGSCYIDSSKPEDGPEYLRTTLPADGSGQDYFDFHLSGYHNHWRFAYKKESGTNDLYLVGYGQFDGYKIVLTPVKSNGEKVKPLDTAWAMPNEPLNNKEWARWEGVPKTSSYEDFIENGSTVDLGSMTAMAKSKFQILIQRTLLQNVIVGLDRNLSFEVGIIFGDSDLTHENFTYDNEDPLFKKTKYKVFENKAGESFYLLGEMKGVSDYRLQFEDICGKSNPSYIAENVRKNDTDPAQVKNIDYLRYGNNINFNEVVSYALAFQFGSGTVVNEVDFPVLTLLSQENSFYGIHNDITAIIFGSYLSMFDTSLDVIFGNYQMPIDSQSYVRAFYQTNDEEDETVLYSGSIYSSAGTSLYYYHNKIGFTGYEDIFEFSWSGGVSEQIEIPFYE